MSDSANLKFDSLDADVAREVRALHRLNHGWNWVLALWPALWALAALAIVHAPVGPIGWATKAACVITIGVAIQALAIVMHEALHGNLFRNKSLDRSVAFLCGIPAFFSGAAYRVAHLHHHRHTRTEQDQDELRNYCRTSGQYGVLFYAWFVVGTVIYMCIVPLKAMKIATSRDRSRLIGEYAIMLVTYIAVLALALFYHRGNLVLLCWLIPAQVAVVMSNVRGVAEHLCTQSDSVWTRTRTTLSNRLVSFMMLNLNYHLEHHLFPGVPWYNLPKLHKCLRPFYENREVFIEHSYVRYAFKALRGGPNQIVRGEHLAHS